jgi:hypothetical protein
MKITLILLAALFMTANPASATTLRDKAVKIAKTFATDSGSVFNSGCGDMGAATAYTLEAFSSDTGIQSFFFAFNTRESDFECSPDYGVDVVFDSEGHLLETRLVNN